jgi:hypothetical protein
MKTLRETLDQLDEISRRDVLKGAGAAVVGAAGDARAGWFSSPKLFANGAYPGRVKHYLGAYSDSGAVGDADKDYDITVKINGNNVVMHVHSRGSITKLNYSMPSDFEFSNFTKTPDGILAKKTESSKSIKNDGYELPPGKTYGDTIDPNVKMIPKNPREVIDTTVETLEIKNDGALKYRKISSSDPAPQDKGYKYHAWGYNGSVKTTGKELNESV